MRIEQLEYVKEVANCKSLVEAARRLHVTQPCLTNAINSLEDELGVDIFIRSKAGAKLTLAGQEILKISGSILDQVDELYRLSAKHQSRQEVHLAIAPAVCNSAILEIIEDYQKTMPDAPIYVHETRPERIFTALTRSNRSIGVFNNSWLSAIDQAEFNIELLYEDKFRVFASCKSPFHGKESLTMQEVLEHYPVATPICDQDIMAGYLNHPKLSMLSTGLYNFSDRESLKNMVVSDKAIACLPSSFAYRDLYIENALWAPLKVSDFDASVNFYMAYPRRKLTHAESTFVGCIRAFYQRWEPVV
ncbi:LysR family transcriptional regulator [Desulfitobacterium chlororespirans]|uniref:Transcriptional regulator, LysR family n=1 Tax=Desulfitobacterium chlororespirans DSM 11544 TaxID=1121395 RepID=A0A1M7UBE9_9FIRM|nr:LysR family transcriptional regulator [Desulfitobacterium chlororespirans]SHN80160.1 transcriptional regulator, LysR family [Desulfitobacterium chlororespirans DSM 11544]